MRWLFCFLVMGVLPACGPAPEPSEETITVSEIPRVEAPESGAEAPDGAFRPIEPTEAGVIGAPTIWMALAPLGATVPEGEEGDQSLSVQIRREDAVYIADVVRSGLLDDSVRADHVRVEFRREPEGWFPTNAFRREQCRRGADAGQWSAAPCP